MNRFAILIDGGFLVKTLESKNRRFPSHQDVLDECARISRHEDLQKLTLLRTYFYHARPHDTSMTNPLDGSSFHLGKSPKFPLFTRLIDELELAPNFALRLGETVAHGWKIGDRAQDALIKKQKTTLEPKDLIPDIEQKGVDLRIGLDIARLSIQRLVDVIVVVTGDSDLIPAFKFARREGVRVYLDHMGHGVRRDLKVHADIVF